MTTNQASVPGRGGYGPFITGIVLIVAAGAYNLVLEGSPRADREVLPPFLVSAYEQSGKLGVTMVIASLGLVIMLWGWMLQTANADRRRARPCEPVGRDVRQATGPGSSVTLDSAKYTATPRAPRQWWTPENYRV